MSSREYDTSPDTGSGKLTLTIAGEKGEGKSTAALMLPGTHAAISLDQKTKLTNEWLESLGHKGNVVYDGVRYYTEDASHAETLVEAAHRSYHYQHAILDAIKTDGLWPTMPDWIIFDDAETLHQMCEGEMRYNHKLGPVESFANLNFWKERRMFLRSLHNKAKNIANRGIVYTTYMDFVKDVVEDEKLIAGKKVPRWIDAVLKESDIALHAYVKDDTSGKRKYMVKVLSTKKHTFIKEGQIVDVTGPDYSKLYATLPILTPIAPASIPRKVGPMEVEIVEKEDKVVDDAIIKLATKKEERREEREEDVNPF
jgi:hypothetical protein